MAFFRQELAIDLGTANTVIFKDGDVVLDEPSIIATDTKSGKLMAIGNHAQLMEEHTPPGITTIRPLMNGPTSSIFSGITMTLSSRPDCIAYD